MVLQFTSNLPKMAQQLTSIYSDGSDDLVEIGRTLDERLTLTHHFGTKKKNTPNQSNGSDAGGDTLTATEWDNDLYGEDAPVMEMVEEY